MALESCDVHPDDHAGLLDWPTYGPRDPEIAQLVSKLAYEHRLQLSEIETIIKDALMQRMAVPTFNVDP